MKIFILFVALFSQISSAQTKLTVSGISSGAYMAQQFHTAFSTDVDGVGIIAGGPYYCAQGKVADALFKCMKTTMGVPDARASVAEAKKLHSSGLIDNPENLRNSRVYVLSGTKDDTVLQKLNDLAVETYKLWGTSEIRYENKLAVGHAMPTDHFGNACGTPASSPFISNCGRDVAGEILTQVLGHLEPKRAQNSSRFFTFDQLAAIDSADVDKLSMHRTGYAYIPSGCEHPEAAGCRIHVAFHGCKQSLDDIQTTYITKAGYNEWAEANKLVIVYPQVVKNTLGNPNACWDWWGYSGANYHTKKGLQMRQVMKLVEALRGGVLQLRQVSL